MIADAQYRLAQVTQKRGDAIAARAHACDAWRAYYEVGAVANAPRVAEFVETLAQ